MQYRSSGTDDDYFEVFISADCLCEMEQAKKLCVEFERNTAKFQKLYEQVRAEMARIILQTTRDRAHQQELRNTYCMHIHGIFNISPPRKLETVADFGLHYALAPALPNTLNYKIASLAICAPAATENIKKSFLPILSKSAPVARKQSQGKKKSNSQPASRAKSPVQFEVSAQASPEEVQKIVKPQAAQAVAPVRLQPVAVKIVYDPRVLRWFDPHTQDVQVLHASRECVEYHCFTRLVDQYLVRCGMQTPWKNRAKMKQSKDGIFDLNYSLGGTIECMNNPKRVVVFTLCKDQKDVFYHRGFELKENNSLFNEYFEKNHWEIFHRDEFPALGVAHSAPFGRLVSNADDEVISEDELCVKIRDNHMDMNIVLYKPVMN